VKRLAARSALFGALFHLTGCTVMVDQQPPSDVTAPLAADHLAPAHLAPASPPNGEVAPTDTMTVDMPAPECKGLAERPCRKNQICTWIIPKQANKSGQVRPAYCRRLGPTKAKAKNAGRLAASAASSP